MEDNKTLSGLEKALENGCRMHGFRSGGGLRVVRIEKDHELKGYGEHPNVEGALIHADEDYLAGGREYGEVYGHDKLHQHYLTGTRKISSDLDEWLYQGSTFDAYKSKDIVVELNGYAETRTPKEVVEQVDKSEGSVKWKSRGYTYETRVDRFPSDDPCYNTKIIETPNGKEGKGADPWMYHIKKTGKGRSFEEALENALKAEEKEVLVFTRV